MFKLAVIGGDERARRLAGICTEAFSVTTLGLEDHDEREACIEDADVLLLPYPFSVINANIPNLRKLTLDPFDILGKAKKDAAVVMGDGLDAYLAAVETLGKTLAVKRYDEDQDFLQDNADISAEGAMCYAMQQSDVTIAGITSLVIGYGLFGRSLALKLRNLGGNVIVAARSETARLKARSEGMRAVDIGELSREMEETHFVMNTVPAPVIGLDAMKKLPADALLLELASAPYGFDLDMAQRMGLAAAKLPGIPGRYAPQSAAKALYGAVSRLLAGGN